MVINPRQGYNMDQPRRLPYNTAPASGTGYGGYSYGSAGSGGRGGGDLSAFWKRNPWQDRFSGLASGYGNLGNQLIGNWTGGNTPAAFAKMFGYTQGAGANDPALGQWMAQMRGNVGNALREGVNRMAGAGVASSRGGFGLPGADLRSVLGKQANEQVAGMASQNFSNAVNYEQQRRNMQNQVAGQMQNWAGTQMGLGGNLLNMQLQATGMGDRSQQAYRNAAYGAHAGDVGWNRQEYLRRQQQAEQDREFELRKQQQAWQQAWGDKEHKQKEFEWGKGNQLQEILGQLFGKATEGRLFPGVSDQNKAVSLLQTLKPLMSMFGGG